MRFSLVELSITAILGMWRVPIIHLICHTGIYQTDSLSFSPHVEKEENNTLNKWQWWRAAFHNWLHRSLLRVQQSLPRAGLMEDTPWLKWHVLFNTKTHVKDRGLPYHLTSNVVLGEHKCIFISGTSEKGHTQISWSPSPDPLHHWD